MPHPKRIFIICVGNNAFSHKDESRMEILDAKQDSAPDSEGNKISYADVVKAQQ
jgi:hypothetical protein